MDDSLTRMIVGIDRARPIDTVLQIGVGDGLAFDAIRATQARRTVLVEPNPDLLEGLELAADGARVRCVTAALSTEPGKVLLRQFNFAVLSGLSAPSKAMTAVFPGLTQIDLLEVEAVTLTVLLDVLAAKAEEANLLVIETPEAATRVIGALLEADKATLFSDIVLRNPAEALFEGTTPIEALVARLSEAGFRVVDRDESDITLPRVHLHIDRVALQLRALEASAAEARERAAQLEVDLKKARSGRDAAQSELSDLAERLKQALERGALTTREAEAQKARADEQAGVLAALKAENEVAAQALKAEKGRAVEAERSRERLDKQCKEQATNTLTLEQRIAVQRETLANERVLRERLEVALHHAEAQMELLHGLVSAKRGKKKRSAVTEIG